MNTPYPGFSPQYTNVDQIGGFTRTCFVLEFLSLGKLDNAQRAIIEEQISAIANKLANNIITAERAEFITPDRFDRKLSDGLRLTPTT